MIIDIQQMSGGPPEPNFQKLRTRIGGKLRQWTSEAGGRRGGIDAPGCQAINYVFVFSSFSPRVASRSQANTVSGARASYH